MGVALVGSDARRCHLVADRGGVRPAVVGASLGGMAALLANSQPGKPQHFAALVLVDITPRIGCHDGVHYGSGYCFAGVPMGTLFGQKIARRILGHEGGESVFDTEPPTKFWYRGNAWFVPHALRWMSRNDR